MQYTTKDYNTFPEDKRSTIEGHYALTVKLPFAQWIASGVKTWEIRSKPTKYRGKIVITSSSLPKVEQMISGSALCVVELVDCVMIKDLPEEGWVNSMLSKAERTKYLYHYAYILKNARPTIEIPVKGNLGIWLLWIDKDELMEYPQELDHYAKQENNLMLEQKLKKEAMRTIFYVFLGLAVIIFLLFNMISP